MKFNDGSEASVSMTKKMKAGWSVLGLVLLMFLLGASCGKQGNIDQGRVIEFDKAAGKVTLIRDSSPDPKKPDYTILPPYTYAVPADPEEMGPDPKAGYRIKLDTEKHEIVTFDPASQSFKAITYTPVDEKKDVAKDSPLVFDKAKNEPRKFPSIDREKKMISIYSPRQKLMITFTIADEYFTLPEKTWDAGDEVRIYYKQEGKALRLMNISRTEIFQ